MNSNNTRQTLYMVELALMTAIIFIMAFTPLGYFRTPGISITFLTVPVAVGAIILGPKGGAVCGLAFGITSLIQCFMGGSFGSMLLSINPVGTAVTCIVPRILEGLLCGLVFRAVQKAAGNSAYFAASLACPLLNTVFFMSAVVLIFLSYGLHSEFCDCSWGIQSVHVCSGICGNPGSDRSRRLFCHCERGIQSAGSGAEGGITDAEP